jgi:uncharacterized protein YndB with AHSA1/START domain
MATRSHVREETFAVSPEELFALLHTPSAIRGWWGAARAIVGAEEGGTWSATWGEDEDAPDYVTFATISTFDPPRRMVLCDYRYTSKTGPLPFKAEFVTEFSVSADGSGAQLKVEQSGFPAGPEADEFYAGCEVGWKITFDGIRSFLSQWRAGVV